MNTNVTKVLAGLEDLLVGRGPIAQVRGNETVTVNRIDIALAVNSTAEMQALDPNKYPRARVYASNTNVQEFIYDPLNSTGIPSTVGPGSWFATSDSTGILAVQDKPSLRSSEPAYPMQIAVTLGDAAKGVGPGGIFWFDNEDTTSPDDGETVFVTTDGARWKYLVIPATTRQDFTTATGTANSIVLDFGVEKLAENVIYSFIAATNSTGSSVTIAADNDGVKPVLNSDLSNLAIGAIQAGRTYHFYVSTSGYVLINPTATNAGMAIGTDIFGSVSPAQVLYAIQYLSDIDSSPDTIILRDNEGRAKIENPAAAKDIANKGYVDAEILSLASVIADIIEATKLRSWTKITLETGVLSVSGKATSSIAATKNNLICMAGDGVVQMYERLANTWTAVGSPLTISGLTRAAICVLDADANTFAIYDSYESNGTRQLRTVQWDGTSLAQVGSALTLSGSYFSCHLTSLTPSIVVLARNLSNTTRLQAYSWSGVSWSAYSAELNLGNAGNTSLAAVSDTDFVIFRALSSNLQMYRLNDGTNDITSVSSAVSVSGTLGNVTATALSGSDFAIYDTGTDTLRLYRWLGAAITNLNVSVSVVVTGTDNVASITAMASNKIGFFDNQTDQLKYFTIEEHVIGKPNGPA